ncbi:ferrochelatase [Zhihengliuella sp.]|uniref:ferrochelatase n=1 Tax=Zhihengliuella sp. TaxID=1954483 RepID=UPI002812018E|nr:ferrochelatase [Zhihengliuella sp.]
MSRAENQTTEGLGYDAVLLASFGGPEGQDDVIPFLRNVTAGRGIPDERLEEVATHYRANGGVSPINEQNRDLLAALEAEIARRDWSLPLYWGNRNWDPYIPEALQQMYDDGHRRVLMLVTSAYAGYSSCCQYREDIAQAYGKTGLEGKIDVVKIRQFFYDRAFIAPFQEALAAGLADVRAQLAAKGEPEAKPKVVFVTHSIPTAIAEAQGPDHVKDEYATDAYTAQHLAVARTLMETVPEAAGLEHSLVFQSRSGAPTTPWLEPDINDAIEEYAAAGTRGVVVMPIGFVSDHMEVKWDLDTEAKDTAAELGLAFHRAPTPGTHAAFVGGLVDIVAEQLHGADGQPPAAGEQVVPGDWSDICCVTGCRPMLTARSGARRPAADPAPAASDAASSDQAGPASR